jgi:hypothetical protein
VTSVAHDTAATGTSEVRFSAIGTTAVLVITNPAAATAAELMLRAELAALDRVCSRFRADSEIRCLERTAGSPVSVSPLLAEVVDTALRAAQLTDGVVDPTVGAAMVSLGYDRDFAALDTEGPAVVAVPAPGWWRIGWDPRSREILLPRGIILDVGATAKALAADRAATRIAEVVLPIMADNKDAAAAALAEPGWLRLGPQHAGFYRRGELPGKQRPQLEGQVIEADAMTQIMARLDLLGTAVEHGGFGDEQAMRITLLVALLSRRISEICLLDRDPLLPTAAAADSQPDPVGESRAPRIARQHTPGPQATNWEKGKPGRLRGRFLAYLAASSGRQNTMGPYPPDSGVR